MPEYLPLDIPDDAGTAVVGDQMVLSLVSDWAVGGATYRSGSIVSTDDRCAHKTSAS